MLFEGYKGWELGVHLPMKPGARAHHSATSPWQPCLLSGPHPRGIAEKHELGVLYGHGPKGMEICCPDVLPRKEVPALGVLSADRCHLSALRGLPQGHVHIQWLRQVYTGSAIWHSVGDSAASPKPASSPFLPQVLILKVFPDKQPQP